MGVLKRIFRISEWFTSKLPLQISVFLILAFLTGLNASSLLFPFLLFIVYSITYFSVGYIANDLSDIESDRLAGKRNAFTNTKVWVGVVAFLVASLLNFATIIFIKRDGAFLLIAFIGYLLGIFYSFKPFRFKERGVLGLLTASLCQRNLQLWIIPFLFQVNWPIFILLNAVCFIYGIRYILIHQYMDYENDLKTGTKTFVISAIKITKGIIHLCVALEMLLCAVVLGLVFYSVNMWLVGVAAVVLGIEISLWAMVRKGHNTRLFTSYFYVPMDTVYLFCMPFISLILIVCANVQVSYFAAVYLLFLAYPFKKACKFYVDYLVFYAKNRKFIRGCRHLWKETEEINGQYFINVIPEFSSEEEKAVLAEIENYAILSPSKVKIPFAQIKELLDGTDFTEAVYTPSESAEGVLKKEIAFFQTKSKSALHYFAIYIVRKEKFWLNRKKDATETIIKAATQSENKRRVDLGTCVSAETQESMQKQKTRFLKFAGLACAELYTRRTDCFMNIIPVQLVVYTIMLALGLVGYFMQPALVSFSVVFILLNGITLFILARVRARKYGVRVKNVRVYNRYLHSKEVGGKRVPFYKVYGIYSDRIVQEANYHRVKASVLFITMTIAMVVAALLMVL